MDLPGKDRSREHQANERTFLAWIRTCIGIMAFGFVVVKFSLFLKQLTFLLGKSTDVPTKGYSGVLGIILVAFGLVVAMLAYVQYRRIDKQIASGTYLSKGTLPAILVSFILIMGVFLLIYLVQSI